MQYNKFFLGLLFSFFITEPCLSADLNSPFLNKATNSCIFSPVQATSEIKININLESVSSIINTNFDPLDKTTYNYKIESNLYDSLGAKHKLNIFFIKKSPNNWTLPILVDDLTVGHGKLMFDTTGNLSISTGLNKLYWSSTTGAVSPIALDIDMKCSTQFGSPFSVTSIWQDGHSEGFNFHETLANKYFYKNTASQCPSQEPRATSIAKIHLNLNATDVISDIAFDPKILDSYNFKTNIWIYDSLGAPYMLSLYYVKNSSNTWSVHVYMYANLLGIGELKFDTSGKLISVVGLNSLSWSPFSGAISPQTFDIDMTCSTQYAGLSTLLEDTWQDGHTNYGL